MPTYPNVPDAPGVPSVPRDPNAVNQVTQQATGGVTVRSYSNKWGIYNKDGTAALAFKSFVSLHIGKEYEVATYPIEDGGFESYNKVERPFTGTIMLTQDGGVAERKAFMVAVADLVSSLNVYTIVTPEKTYSSANFVHFEYDRSGERGLGLIRAELRFVEIRQTAEAAFSSTAAPDGAGVVDGGNVQPLDLTPVQQTAIPQALQPYVTKSVPLVATPSLKFTTQLSGQNTKVELFQKATGLFSNVYVNDVAIALGTICQNGNTIIKSPYLPFVGDLAFFDTQGDSDPDYTGMGSRYFLGYLKSKVPGL